MNSEQAKISASELGNLWQAYMEKTMLLRVLEYFLELSNDEVVKSIFQNHYNKETLNVEAIKTVFEREGAVVPEGYTGKDVNKEAPRLYDGGFDLFFIRTMTEVLMGLYTLHLGMSYRKDIRQLYNRFIDDLQDTSNQVTEYLLEQGILIHPPIVPLPKEVEYVDKTSYMSGMNILKPKRVLNTVEIGLLYQSLEINAIGTQLMTSFAQVAENDQSKKYFARGKELAKQVTTTMQDILLESDIHPPSIWAGEITESTLSPFSDKLMMYITNMLSVFSLSGNTFGSAFSMRNDLTLKLNKIMKDTFDFAEDGGKIMIEHGWMEEPPQAADRRKLSKE
ncbi:MULTISPECIES: DUF3231 family protein [Halobacillus]|uniref:DUF3231 family protein n=1 Tax=Halobacillus TaxID=45667 RepID=UPI0013CFDD0B|nr:MULTISPECIES: DUF3231 family protein [Halobacillus]